VEIVNFDLLKHYGSICDWWRRQGWEPIPLDMLPKTGLVVEEKGLPLAAGFLYSSDANISWFEFMVTNPDTEKRVNLKAINLLVESILKRSKEMGYPLCFTSTIRPGLVRIYKKHGFQVGDTGSTQLVWRG
jgi:hypothetical protein